jgi:hypothetical protein
MRETNNEKQNRTVTPQRTRRQGQRLTPEEKRIAQEKFLESFSNTANVRAACMKAGIARRTVYAWQEHDETFSLQFKQAELDANDMIRGEIFRRGVQGYEKPVTSMGKQVYVDDPKNKGKQIPLMERVYSDNLLALLARARMPEFRDKSASITITTTPKEYVNTPDDDGIEEL